MLMLLDLSVSLLVYKTLLLELESPIRKSSTNLSKSYLSSELLPRSTSISSFATKSLP